MYLNHGGAEEKMPQVLHAVAFTGLGRSLEDW